MTVSGSARFHRRSLPPPQKPKKTFNCYPMLLSCCLFLVILCICLLSALVLIGKHLYNNDSAVTPRVEKIGYERDLLLGRLPNDTRPLHYDLTFKPNIQNGRFEANVNITIEISRAKRNVTVHSKNLNINDVNLLSAHDWKVTEVQNVKENTADETVSILLADEILPGTYYLNVKYSGNMINKTKGLYRSRYLDDARNERNIVTSKFEPTYARQAFPCFDEPSFKANYTVHILKPKEDGYIALSNMPQVKKEEPVDNGIMISFDTSVKMSTYLTCFIVCDFEPNAKTVQTADGKIDVKVYASPAQINKTEEALSVTEGVIKYFVQYFKFPYPLPKLDLIAIPDFVSGAMEHWGLVTFRETALLYDKELSSTINRQRVASVVAHELAHSWFGNLVTMKWWDDLWLNEGFASYIQYKGVNEVYPEWNMMDQFLIETLHGVLSIDALPSSHPIIKTVTTPDEITEIFDTITYSKGASILRMLENAVTEEKFQAAVQNYLEAHKFDNAVTQDLLDQLQKLVGKELDVVSFVDTWIQQMGYPILTVTEEGNNYILKQKRFLKDPTATVNNSSPFNYKWTVPVTYITDKSKTPELRWFNYTTESLTIPKPEGITWIKFNPKQVGYYRINYNSEQWKILSDKIQEKDILETSDRTHLLEESFAIAETGELSYKIPLDLTKYLEEELEYIPWSVAASKLIELRKYLSPSHYFDYLNYITRISKPVYDSVGWVESEKDEHLKHRARITILRLRCLIENKECLDEASRLLEEWFTDPNTENVTNNLRSIIYKYGMVNADKTNWDKMLERFKEEEDANEKMNMLSGLAAVRHPNLLKYLIELGKDESIIRGQDYFTMLQYVSDNPIGTSIVWDYVRENWDYLVNRFTLNERNLGKLIPSITSTFTTEAKLTEMEDFFKKYPEAGAGKAAREQSLETVKANIHWIVKNKEEVEGWIKENANEST